MNPLRNFTPAELAIVRAVFDAISSEPWYNSNAVTDRELLKLVLNSYVRGEMDQAGLLSACVEAARSRFSKIR